MGSKATILIRGIDEPIPYSFDYPLEAELKKIIGSNNLTLDSLSDSMIIPYIEKMIENNDKTYLVLDLRISANPGIGRSLLNKFIKQQNIELLCVGDTLLVVPFLKHYHGKTFNGESELIRYLNSN